MFPSRPRNSWLATGFLLLGSLAIAACPAMAQDFRVENQVFLGGQAEPVSHSTTIFQGGEIYDFLDKPEEVFVCLPAAGRVVLLDVGHRSLTEIPFERANEFTGEIQQRAEKQTDPYVQFMVRPQFQTQTDPATGALVFSSPWLVYRVATLPAANRAMAAAYREFSDWNLRVSPMLTAGARPPFARLWINGRLAEQGLLPSEVSLTVIPKRGAEGQPTFIRSKHQFTPQLTPSDLKRTAQAKQSLAAFKAVSISQYRKLVE